MSERTYTATVVESSRELTAKERVMMKDTSDALMLNDLAEKEPVLIDPEFWCTVAIHNEKSDNKDYNVYLIVDKNGAKYKTSSENFMNSFEDIMADMAGCDEPFSVKVYTLPSKNRTGQSFLTCSLV
jgi:hypothetical protein